MWQHAQAVAHRDEPQDISWIPPHFLYDTRAKSGVSTLSEEFVIELGPGFTGGENKILPAQILEHERGLLSEWVAPRQHNLKWHPPNHLMFEAFERSGKVHESEVNPALAQS